MPDEGMFEKIQRRLKVRRALRWGGASLVALVVVGGAALLMWPKGSDVPADTAMATNVAEVPATLTVGAQGEVTADARGGAVAKVSETSEAPSAVRMAETAGVARADARPSDATDETTTDEDDLWAMLPQGMPVVARLDEPAEAMMLGVEFGSLDTSAGSTTAVAGAAGRDHSKAGQPVPHFDNVLWAPNLIVPGGDVDENRHFSIKTTSTITAFKLHIYNRSGRRIYLTTDPDFVWDATMDGTPVPQGAYVWVATFRDTDGNSRQEQGTVTVIR